MRTRRAPISAPKLRHGKRAESTEEFERELLAELRERFDRIFYEPFSIEWQRGLLESFEQLHRLDEDARALLRARRLKLADLDAFVGHWGLPCRVDELLEPVADHYPASVLAIVDAVERRNLERATLAVDGVRSDPANKHLRPDARYDRVGDLTHFVVQEFGRLRTHDGPARSADAADDAHGERPAHAGGLLGGGHLVEVGGTLRAVRSSERCLTNTELAVVRLSLRIDPAPLATWVRDRFTLAQAIDEEARRRIAKAREHVVPAFKEEELAEASAASAAGLRVHLPFARRKKGAM
ncbi:MAG: hypothetical protein HYV09_29220 [Deltaproteobacteria bacterium]|nr:hypothetical protein [Deltaproteobacteria bacterium]